MRFATIITSNVETLAYYAGLSIAQNFRPYSFKVYGHISHDVAVTIAVKLVLAITAAAFVF